MAGASHPAHPAKHPAPPTIHIKVNNRLRHHENVSGATVEVVGAGPAAVTNSHGVATLHLSTPGSFTLRVTPADAFDGDVGPTLATTVPVPAHIFRSFEATVAVNKHGKIATAFVDPLQTSNGSVALGHDPNLTVHLQPVWIASPNHHSRRGKDIDLIIVHHTGGTAIGSALNEFLNSTGRQVSAHYVINVDGQIVKMVQDAVAANHAGVSFWDGVDGVNDNSIGIEIVNKSGPFTEEQFTSLLNLLDLLVDAHDLDANRIVGHSDIALNDHKVLGRKSTDPGLQFKWTRLEELGFGLIPDGTTLSATDYGGFFNTFPRGSLHKGDNDAHHKFGGKVHKAITGTPVQELQEDLAAIGYFVGTPDGDFGAKLDGAVKMFQEHFFGGTRSGGHLHNGHVDQATAEMIKKVVP